ncbi:hypothetical protein LJC07_06070 [Christensenellaceae bacterium OttesenSCG-928-L17]|nr:hypothetical protein [Christensenellaceae bacterium OttesenSCG-928-L17]
MSQFSKEQLTKLREIMRDALGLELEDEAVYDAAIAVCRFVGAKERQALLAKLKEGVRGG